MRAFIITLACLAASSALAQNCPPRDVWPGKDWSVQLVDATAKADAIKKLEDYVFTLQGADGDRLGLRTDSFVIIKHGVIVYERYGRGFTATNKHISWSVAKSISSTLVGVAVKQGVLKLDDSICKYLTEYAGSSSPVCDIRVIDTITFGTGLRWQEGYEHASYQTSSVINMLFGVGHRDNLRHILTHETEKAPGTRWMYSTGDAGLAATLAKRALLPRFGKDAFWDLLFDKLGAAVAFQQDVLGSPQGGMLVYATPRDFARIGYLMMNDGCWAGERLLPEGWVKAATTPSDVFINGAPEGEDTPTGYAWWLNQPVTELKDANGVVIRKAAPKPWTDAPGDAFGADGHWGQYIWVVPSQDVVIMRTADDRNDHIDQGKAIGLALEVAR
jgi:CubicO group peptidase (beta-lactamase class C family)